MPGDDHVHFWIVQDEDTPTTSYLTCLHCGMVVDPVEFCMMLDLLRRVADGVISEAVVFKAREIPAVIDPQGNRR